MTQLAVVDDVVVHLVFDLRAHPFELRSLYDSLDYVRNTKYGLVAFVAERGNLFIGGSRVFAKTAQCAMVDSPPSIAFMAAFVNKVSKALTCEMLGALYQHPELIPQEFWGKKLLALDSIYRRRGGKETFYLLYDGPGTTPQLAQVDLYANWTEDYLALVVDAVEETTGFINLAESLAS